MMRQLPLIIVSLVALFFGDRISHVRGVILKPDKYIAEIQYVDEDQSCAYGFFSPTDATRIRVACAAVGGNGTSKGAIVIMDLSDNTKYNVLICATARGKSILIERFVDSNVEKYRKIVFESAFTLEGSEDDE